MELKSEDRYILEKLAEELKCGNKIYDRHRITNKGEGHMSNFSSCNSKQLFDDLAKFNIIPDKSHTTNSFKNIMELVDVNLIKHFLRGIIDGDGSISDRNSCVQIAIGNGHQGHIRRPVENIFSGQQILFHGVLDMSLHRI